MSKKMPLATYYFTIYNECSSITLFYVSNSVDIMLKFWYKPPSLLVPAYLYLCTTYILIGKNYIQFIRQQQHQLSYLCNMFSYNDDYFSK